VVGEGASGLKGGWVGREGRDCASLLDSDVNIFFHVVCLYRCLPTVPLKCCLYTYFTAGIKALPVRFPGSRS